MERLRRLLWWRRPIPLAEGGEPLELPWNRRWHQVAKRTAGPDFHRDDYRQARANARAVAQATLGDDLWERAQQQGYLDLASKRFPGVTYRLRIGRRIEVRCASGVQSPWPFSYLCINPTYPLPEEEFFAHIYLYLHDSEDDVVRLAAPQPWDQILGRTF